MSDSSEQPWSGNPNAPQIPYWLYLQEKGNLAGNLISLIFYGIAVALFFRCMNALLNPANRKSGGVKWVLVVHTIVMFLIVTGYTAINIYFLFVSYIDNREFPGTDELIPGPLGYDNLIASLAPNTACNVLFTVNQWLADGLLLYRFCIIYTMNYWVIAFPCLMYIASLGMGITFFYELARQDSLTWNLTAVLDFGLAYWSFSFGLNILLMLLIVIRLGLHHRNIRKAVGGQAGAGGLYKAVIAMLIESFSLYAINFLLYLGPWIVENFAQFIFLPILGQTEVIAPFLIILRVANRTALTSEAVASGNLGSIHFNNQDKSTDVDGNVSTLLCEDPVGSVNTDGGDNPDVGVERTIEEVPL